MTTTEQQTLEQQLDGLKSLHTWRPIETAPQGVEVLVLRRDGVMHVARVGGLKGKRWGILDADFGNASCQFFFPVDNDYEADDTPEFWVPLPIPAPETLARAESNASGTSEWESVSKRVSDARAALIALGMAPVVVPELAPIGEMVA